MISRRNVRQILAFLVVAAVAGIVAVIVIKSARRPALQPVQQVQTASQSPEIVMGNVTFNELSGGIPLWELVASRAEYDKSGEKALLDGLRMTYFRSRSAGDIFVEASKGTYGTASRNVLLEGAVLVETESGMELATDELHYDAAAATFTANRPVSFNQGRLRLKAGSMVLSVQDQQVKFRGKVDATIETLAEKP